MSYLLVYYLHYTTKQNNTSLAAWRQCSTHRTNPVLRIAETNITLSWSTEQLLGRGFYFLFFLPLPDKSWSRKETHKKYQQQKERKKSMDFILESRVPKGGGGSSGGGGGRGGGGSKSSKSKSKSKSKPYKSKGGAVVPTGGGGGGNGGGFSTLPLWARILIIVLIVWFIIFLIAFTYYLIQGKPPLPGLFSFPIAMFLPIFPLTYTVTRRIQAQEGRQAIPPRSRLRLRPPRLNRSLAPFLPLQEIRHGQEGQRQGQRQQPLGRRLRQDRGGQGRRRRQRGFLVRRCRREGRRIQVRAHGLRAPPPADPRPALRSSGDGCGRGGGANDRRRGGLLHAAAPFEYCACAAPSPVQLKAGG